MEKHKKLNVLFSTDMCIENKAKANNFKSFFVKSIEEIKKKIPVSPFINNVQEGFLKFIILLLEDVK